MDVKQTNKQNNNLLVKKWFRIIGAILVIIPLCVILFISPITKYLVEKYSVEYTGRQIKIDWAFVNPFTGYVYFKNVKIYEYKSDSTFISAAGLSAKFRLGKLFSETCEISTVTLDQPKGIIIKNQSDFNFSDITERFRSKPSSPGTHSFHVNVFNIKISDGVLTYRETTNQVNYSAIHLNISSPGVGWDSDTLNAKVSLISGNGGGGIKGNITINLENLDFKLNALIDKLQIKFLEQYFRTISNYGSFRAALNANLNVVGSFKDAEKLRAKGLVDIDDFHFGETDDKDFASFEKFNISINELNPKGRKYVFDSISLNHPYFKYELYDYLNNVELMFSGKGESVSNIKSNPGQFNLILVIGDYIKTLARDFFKSYYKVDRLGIYNGDFKYNDYSLNERFSADAFPVSVTADSINKSKSRVNVYFKSGIKPYGNGFVRLSINPNDSSDFDLNYKFQGIPITQFNPYFITYTSYPFDRGTLDIDGKWKSRNSKIEAENHLLIVDPRITLREKNKANRWVPVWLLMAFVRDRGSVIDYTIPVTGKLSKPNWHFKEVVLGILKNIFVKPATTLYRRKVKETENVVEKSLALKWQMNNSRMLKSQEKLMSKLADFLADNPSATLTVYPQQYLTKEKEYILLFEAKKKYYLSSHAKESNVLSLKDSEAIDKMSIKDSLFVYYLNKQINRKLMYTVQEKCIDLIGEAFVDKQFSKLMNERKETFISYFKKKGVVGKVVFKQPQNGVPYNGFSFYKITYNGELPGFLKRAYEEMDELNSRPPREMYNKERSSIGEL